MDYNKARQSQVYKQYCDAIAKKTGLTGKELSNHIAETNRRCYQVLFGNREIRQRMMDEQQLERLTEHRQLMIDLMA